MTVVYKRNKRTLSKIYKLGQEQHQVQQSPTIISGVFNKTGTFRQKKKTYFYILAAKCNEMIQNPTDSTQEFSLTCGRFISKCNAPVTVCEYIHLEMLY